ncbi:unnamed protein product [Calypogeia fissa]
MIEPKKKTTQTGGQIAMATLSLEKGKSLREITLSTPRTTEGEEALTMEVAKAGGRIEDPIDLEKELRIPSTAKCVTIPDARSFVLKKVKIKPMDKLAGFKPGPKTAKKNATQVVEDNEEEEMITRPGLQREEQPPRKQKVTEEAMDKGKIEAKYVVGHNNNRSIFG